MHLAALAKGWFPFLESKWGEWAFPQQPMHWKQISCDIQLLTGQEKRTRTPPAK